MFCFCICFGFSFWWGIRKRAVCEFFLKSPNLKKKHEIFHSFPRSPVVPSLQVTAPARGAAVAPVAAAPVVALAAALLLALLAALSDVGGEDALHGLAAEVDVAAGLYFFCGRGKKRGKRRGASERGPAGKENGRGREKKAT